MWVKREVVVGRRARRSWGVGCRVVVEEVMWMEWRERIFREGETEEGCAGCNVTYVRVRTRM